MTRRKFSREFKIEAVKLVTERGVAVAQACRDLDLAESILRRWMREATAAPVTAFPGNGQQRADQAGIAALKKEVARLKAERDLPQKRVASGCAIGSSNHWRRLLRAGSDMTFAFVAKHRHIWPLSADLLRKSPDGQRISWMCDVLGVSRSGFQAWLRRPISARASYDAKLVVESDKSFKASDRTYGARRVWRDVLEDGLACGLHRIERLMRQNALRARPKRRGKADALLHHSDQGSQYTSEQFQRLLLDNGITCSMSRAGNVWDTSAMESFFSSLTAERTARKVYRNRDAGRADVFDYIERFYNPRRRHSKPGYISPMAFEDRAMQT